jgi:hypothetical protein
MQQLKKTQSTLARGVAPSASSAKQVSVQTSSFTPSLKQVRL